jgi:hypothetical protein
VEDHVVSVRHAVAAHCASLCTLLGGGRLGEQWSTWTVNTLQTFLRDDDGAVRAAAIDAIPFIFTLLRGFAHRYVYHASFWPTLGLSITPLTSDPLPSNSIVPWIDVESLIMECCNLKHEQSDAVILMAVNSMKRAASMLLPTLLKLAQDAPEDVRCKVATAAGRLLLQVREEFTVLGLNGSGLKSNSNADAKALGWKLLRSDLTEILLGPLLKALTCDGNRTVMSTLFSEMAGLPQSFNVLESDGGLGAGRRGRQPMSSVFSFCYEMAGTSDRTGAHKIKASTRTWTSVEVCP